jgi:trans-aconitate methyltransferase
MINQAKGYLSSFKNVLVIESDLLNVELPRRVDVIFSNPVLHWILDHKRLFKQFWKLLSEDSNNENKRNERERTPVSSMRWIWKFG